MMDSKCLEGSCVMWRSLTHVSESVPIRVRCMIYKGFRPMMTFNMSTYQLFLPTGHKYTVRIGAELSLQPTSMTHTLKKAFVKLQ